jgi:hypothetical protein
MPETAKDMISPEKLYSDRLTWAEFQSALDAYRDAAYWAGYRDAKSEILESFIKGEK